MRKVSDLPARFVGLLVQYLEQQGIDCTPALQAAAIDRETLQHPDAMLSTEQMVQSVRLLSSSSERGDLGLLVGQLIGFGMLGELGRAMLTAANLREGLRCCARHYGLITPSYAVQTRQTGHGLFEMRGVPIRPVPYDLVLMAFDLCVTAFHTQLKQAFDGQPPPYDVYLSTPPPAHHAQYRKLAPARYHFSQPGLLSLRIELDDSLLDKAPPLSNALEHEHALQRLSLRMSHAPGHGHWSDWVKMMLRESPACQPTQEDMAALVNLSGSTLARYLADEGKRFRQLANDVRHEQACQWLAEGRLLIGDIAHRLGYANPANFVRAFKSQAGVTPSDYARGLKAGSA